MTKRRLLWFAVFPYRPSFCACFKLALEGFDTAKELQNRTHIASGIGQAR